jgi:hypothetical protein
VHQDDERPLARNVDVEVDSGATNGARGAKRVRGGLRLHAMTPAVRDWLKAFSA